MGNDRRTWLVFGVAAAIAAGALLFQWDRSAADDAPAATAADSKSVSFASDGTLAQAVQRKRGSAEESIIDKTLGQPAVTSYSLHATENDERIRTALTKTANFDFNDTPLRDALAEIGKHHGIRAWMDERALTDLNITNDTPVTRKLSDISLKSALRLLLRPLQLTFHVDRGVLQITSQTEYDNRLEVRVYPVGDVVAPFSKPDVRDEADFDSLIDLIDSTIAPTSWDVVGGPGSMSPHGQTLVVSQTADVHEQIEGLVRALRSVRADQRKQLGGPGVDINSDQRSTAIRKALEKPIAGDWEFNDLSLRDALGFIAKTSGIQIQIDERALTDLNITLDTPVTSRLGGIPLKAALELFLRPLQLTYVVDNEVLSITSQTEADNLLQVRVYPVGDLLECESDEKGIQASSCDFDSLIDLILSTVAPTSWNTVGGPAEIGMYEGALALVISQTQDVHALVDGLLASMRKARPGRHDKGVATGTADDKGSLTTRVYALWQFGPPRERHAGIAQANPMTTPVSSRRGSRARAENSAQFGGVGGGLPPSGFGGAPLSEHEFATTPPPGVPAEQTAEIIRRFVEPESWKQQGVVLHAAPNRLVIRQTAAVLKKTEELLEQLGPWRDVKKIVIGGGLGGTTGAVGGAFQVDDPFAPAAERKADQDPFEAPARQAGPSDPFGAPAAADPFDGAPAQPAPRDRPADANESADKAAAAVPAGKRDRLQARAAPYLPSAAESRIREQLAAPTEMEFNDLPLRDALNYLKQRHGIEIQIDDRALTDLNITSDTPVTRQLKGISLRSALRLLLRPLQLTYVVDDEVLLITTREGAAHGKSVRIYDVSDFAEQQAPIGRDPFGPPGPQPPPYVAGPISGVQGLVNVIEQAIAPGTWGAKHGSGIVLLVRNDSALLVVHHSADVHDEIVDLLSSLREVQRRTRRAER